MLGYILYNFFQFLFRMQKFIIKYESSRNQYSFPLLHTHKKRLQENIQFYYNMNQ